MATAKKSTMSKTNSNQASSSVASNGLDEMAKDTFDRVKDAIPAMDEVASDVRDYVQDQVPADMRRLADDATDFVRRNPGTSLAAAAGVGILIGILAAKRS